MSIYSFSKSIIYHRSFSGNPQNFLGRAGFQKPTCNFPGLYLIRVLRNICSLLEKSLHPRDCYYSKEALYCEYFSSNFQQFRKQPLRSILKKGVLQLYAKLLKNTSERIHVLVKLQVSNFNKMNSCTCILNDSA